MEKLKQAYDSKVFNQKAKALVDILTQHIESATTNKGQANQYHSPEESLNFWSKHWSSEHSTEELFQDIIDRSIHIHDAKYIGHQVTPTLPIAGIASFLSSMLNNGMANYEMGNVSSTLEKLVVDFVLEKFGWKEDGNGFLTSGGTLANLTALLAARNAKAPNVWKNGYENQLVVFITAEAHYCVERALRVMGFGDEGIVKIPVNSSFKMDLDALKLKYEKVVAQGKKPIALVASACSTSTGMYDDIDQMANFCIEHNLWLHIDGAHGAAVVFSDTYRHLIKGIDRADSIVLDAHKMMMVPALCTYTLFKNQSHCNSNFAQKAQYLWEKADDEDWYNYGRKTFECTKYMMSIKIYAIIKEHGEDVFKEYIDTLYQRTHWFGSEILKRSEFELLQMPESNILCFRYIGNLAQNQYNAHNKRIRQMILEDGEYYIVQTELNGELWLRISLMNPFTSEEILSHLLDKIVSFS
jgi:L-2,4-diaminobutyrate decarboxylase